MLSLLRPRLLPASLAAGASSGYYLQVVGWG